MSGEFKQCQNGHYYQGSSCPYCKSSSSGTGTNTSLKTEIYVGSSNNSSQMPTNMQPGNGGEANSTVGSGGTKTTVVDGQETVVNGSACASSGSKPTNRTVFGDEPEILFTQAGQVLERKVYRNSRKLVGWLVSYSSDTMGIDYKLYEGRNIIGRDADCSITVNDGMITGKHAVILYRADKYSLTDSQSSHGTFVNDQDIDLEPRQLNDGDVIRMGETIFKFRTSL